MGSFFKRSQNSKRVIAKGIDDAKYHNLKCLNKGSQASDTTAEEYVPLKLHKPGLKWLDKIKRARTQGVAALRRSRDAVEEFLKKHIDNAKNIVENPLEGDTFKTLPKLALRQVSANLTKSKVFFENAFPEGMRGLSQRSMHSLTPHSPARWGKSTAKMSVRAVPTFFSTLQSELRLHPGSPMRGTVSELPP